MRPSPTIGLVGESRALFTLIVVLMAPACFSDPQGDGSGGDGEDGDSGDAGDGSATDAGADGGDGGDDGGGSGDGGDDGGSGSGDDGGGSDTGGDSTSEPTECGAGEVCVPEAPGGWNGPVVVVAGADPGALPTCGGDYPDEIGTGADGLDPGHSTCECECGPAADIECNDATMTRFSNATCQPGSETGTHMLTPDQCGFVPITTTGSSQYEAVEAVFGTPRPGTGRCEPRLTEVHDPPAWQAGMRACGGASASGGCGGPTLCLPDPGADFRMCVHRMGDVPCPAGDYSDRNVWFDDFDDNRGCDACQCSPPAGATCGGNFTLLEPDCGGTELSTIDGMCILMNLPNPPQGVRYNPEVTGGSCMPSTGNPVGSVEPVGPTTVCCLP